MKLPQMHEILGWTSFACILTGAAGITGTLERETTDPAGILTAAAMLLAGLVCAVWSAHEDGRRKRWDTHGLRKQD